MLQRLHPADAETFLENLLPMSPVSVSRTQEMPGQTKQCMATPQSMVTPQPTVLPLVAPCRDRTISVCFPVANETFPYMLPGWSVER